MSDVLAVVGAILGALFVLGFGGVWGQKLVEDRCKSAHPIVIENKVYRCVEEKK
jgi:hypothetical protein